LVLVVIRFLTIKEWRCMECFRSFDTIYLYCRGCRETWKWNEQHRGRERDRE